MKFFIYILISALFSFAPMTEALSAEVIDRIAAIVNDDAILDSEVDEFATHLKSGAIVDDLLSPDPKKLLGDRKALLEHVIDERVIDSEIRRKNLSVTSEQVEKEIAKIASRNNINRAQLKTSLKEQGTNFSDYQDFIKKRLERQALIEQSVTSKIKITDDEVLADFIAHKSAKSSKETYDYKLAQILFMGNGAAIERRAAGILERIRKGESFEVLASKYSEDPNFSADGVLGDFKTGEFPKEIENPVSSLKTGDVSNLVHTKTGIHIFKLLDKKLVGDPELDAQKETIRQKLYQVAFQRQFSFWLSQRRADSFIRINNK